MATAKSNKKNPKTARAEKAKAKPDRGAKAATAKGGVSKTAATKIKAAKNDGEKAGIKKAEPKKSSGKLGAGKKAASVKATADKTSAVKGAAGKTTAKKPPPKMASGKKPAKAGKKPPDPDFHLEHIESRTLAKIIDKLEEMREESQHIVNSHLQLDLMPREESLDVGDDLDQASNERDREFNLIMHQRHLRRLQQIDEAYDRMNDGSYGLCEGTDETINPKRLLIMPLTKYSIEYQEMQEKTLGRTSMDGSFSDLDESFGSDE